MAAPTYLVGMASTLTKILLHITFSTKNRQAVLPAALEPGLFAYMGGICRRMQSPVLTINGTVDHVHMLVSLAKTVALSSLMMELKRDSSKWIKENDAAMQGFEWQDGYFAFSIGESGVEALTHYIANQKEHHKTVDFKDEMRTFLRKYGIEWDERYVWDQCRSVGAAFQAAGRRVAGFRGCRRKASSTPGYFRSRLRRGERIRVG